MITIVIFDYDKSIIGLYEKHIKTLEDKRIVVHAFSKEQDVLNFVKTNRVDILITECIGDETHIRGLEHNCGLQYLQNIRTHLPNIKIMICSTYSSHWVSELLNDIVGIKKPIGRGEFLRILKSLIKTG